MCFTGSALQKRKATDHMDWSFQVKLEILWHVKRWADTSQKLQPKKKRREKIISDKLVVLLRNHFYYTKFDSSCFESSLENLDCRVILLSFSFPLTQKKYYPLKTVGIKLKPSPSCRNSLEALKPRTSSFLPLNNGALKISAFCFAFKFQPITVQVCSWDFRAVLWLVETQAKVLNFRCTIVQRW